MMTPLQAFAYYDGLLPKERREAFIEAVSLVTKEQYAEAEDIYNQLKNEPWFEEFCGRHPT